MPHSMTTAELRALRRAAADAGLAMEVLQSDGTPRAVASFALGDQPHAEHLFAIAVDERRGVRRLVMSFEGREVDLKGQPDGRF